VIGVHTLNSIEPPVEETRLHRAWASLAGFKEDQITDHAKRRFMSSLESSFSAAPRLTQQLVELIHREPTMKPVRHLFDT
jgi:hypothetical protein